MSDTLHESHRWGERNGVPLCLDCRVEGYEDEPDAFDVCLGPPVKKPYCNAEMPSREDPGHVHRCVGGPPHGAGSHICRSPDCRRWFGKR